MVPEASPTSGRPGVALAGAGRGRSAAAGDLSRPPHEARAERMLDETEFLSSYGIRALSRVYAEHPYELDVDGARYTVDYQPAESNSGLFGGNSNC